MKQIKKIIICLFMVFLLTGCTEYKMYNNQSVSVAKTGQKLVENILCKTEQTEQQYQEIIDKNKNSLLEQLNNGTITQEDYDTKVSELEQSFDLSNINSCSEFNVFSGKDGLWTTLFVKTLAWLLIKIGTITTNYGWAIIIVTLIIRLALYPITNKTALQSENLKLAQNKLNRLEDKYRNRDDKESQMMKAQEMMKIYKEYNINPMSGCIFALIQIPLFFAFYEALYRLPVVLEETFLGINLGITPLMAFQNGKYYYIIFVALTSLATYFSFKLNSTANEGSKESGQMKMMSNISVVMISIASFSISTGIALYWIVNNGFTIIQNILVKRRKKNDHIK